VAEPVCPPLTPRRATWLVWRRATKRTEAETQHLTQLQAQHAEVAEAIDLAQDFATLVRQRQPAQLDPWLKRATTSTLDALRRFALGLSADYAAIKAGGTVPWSTGPVEGHINRLKMLKRQMLGRAHLDLLRQRFLRTPRAQDASAISAHGRRPRSQSLRRTRRPRTPPAGWGLDANACRLAWLQGRSEGLRSGPTSDRYDRRSLAARA
jgi:transposase